MKDDRAKENRARPVRGHLCAELRNLQGESDNSCVPHVDRYGRITACDDTNRYPILFCPMCGEKLPAYEPPPLNEWGGEDYVGDYDEAFAEYDDNYYGFYR